MRKHISFSEMLDNKVKKNNLLKQQVFQNEMNVSECRQKISLNQGKMGSMKNYFCFKKCTFAGLRKNLKL